MFLNQHCTHIYLYFYIPVMKKLSASASTFVPGAGFGGGKKNMILILSTFDLLIQSSIVYIVLIFRFFVFLILFTFFYYSPQSSLRSSRTKTGTCDIWYLRFHYLNRVCALCFRLSFSLSISLFLSHSPSLPPSLTLYHTSPNLTSILLINLN